MMKSPITGKDMPLKKERRTLEYRKESLDVVYHYYQCKDTHEQYTSTALDEINIHQLHNKYRHKFNIPFPEEIIRIREKYGLPATKMSEILGFGVNSYRQYEAGEMPSVANAKLIQVVNDPEKFIDMVRLCGTLDEKTKEKYCQKAMPLVEQQKQNMATSNVKNYLLGAHLPDVYSGYRNPNFDKFMQMVVFFSEKLSPYKTKMNKLLFYADFLMFKRSCFSISGVRYKAIDRGPVPTNFQSIFEYMANQQAIDICTKEFSQGYVGEQFIARKNKPFQAGLFTESELDVLKKVAATFKQTKTNDMIEISHLEEAWKKNEKNKDVISYEYAFDLKQL